MARYIDDNIGEAERNQGEYDFAVGVTLPTGTDLSGKTATSLIEKPGGDVIESDAVISGVNIYHTVDEDELDEEDWFWYWIIVDGRQKYGPIGIKVLAVPEVTA